jgi:pyruvate dehydrogenase E2 component (dihydrolipoamide acetyltransferase)
MATNIIMPQGGQDLVEGKVLRWFRAEGEAVKKGEVICEVETEKAAFDVDAPADGLLLKIVAGPGTVVPIFAVIGVVGQAGERLAAAEPAPAASEPAPTASMDLAAIRKRLGKGPDAPTEAVRLSGRARKLAEERGIDVRTLRGSGPGGRITEKDVLDQAQGAPAPAAAVVSAPVATEARGKVVRLSKRKAAIAKRMQQSKQAVPHFYVSITADMTEAVRLREELNAKAVGKPGAKITVTDMVAKATASALREMPEVNCSFQGDSLVLLDEINLGIAVGLDDGLVVPVLPKADGLSLQEVATGIRDLIATVKEGKQPNLEVGTFTITNLGMADVESFSAIINPPECAILAVGSILKRVTVGDKDAIRVRDLMTMTLSADHRAIDGITAARFVNRIRYHLETPRRLLVEPT